MNWSWTLSCTSTLSMLVEASSRDGSWLAASKRGGGHGRRQLGTDRCSEARAGRVGFGAEVNCA